MFEYHTAIKNNEEDLFILKWKDCQDTLLNNKNKVQTVCRICYHGCEKKQGDKNIQICLYVNRVSFLKDTQNNRSSYF